MAESMIGQEISHYRVLERLGGGGMGEVFKAQNLRRAWQAGSSAQAAYGG